MTEGYGQCCSRPRDTAAHRAGMSPSCPGTQCIKCPQRRSKAGTVTGGRSTQQDTELGKQCFQIAVVAQHPSQKVASQTQTSIRKEPQEGMSPIGTNMKEPPVAISEMIIEHIE